MDSREKTAPNQSENVRRYTIDELLALMEPQYREDQNTIRQCIAGLTEHAAQLAAKGQEELFPLLREFCIEMAEFWGLTDDDTPSGYQEIAKQYGEAFDHAVSAARDSGQIPEMSEQTRRNILDGLELYADEMRNNDAGLEFWAVECDILAETLKEQWRLEAADFQQAPTAMDSMIL